MNTDRNLSIGDGLILIAGIAAGMALVRLAILDCRFSIPEEYSNQAGVSTLEIAFNLLLGVESFVAVPFLAAWTPACLLVQLNGSQWRRLRRRPGFVACLIASIIMLALVAVAVTLGNATFWNTGQIDAYLGLISLVGSQAGWGVLWGWAAMRLCGVSRPVPSWADRLGRFTGAVWVAVGLLGAFWLTMYFCSVFI